jgi:hypothetical protein
MFVLSKMSVVKFKVLCKQVLMQASGAPVDEQKLAKLLSDGKLESHEVKGAVAALHFIFLSSARYDVAEETLVEELQQLGLPKEHTEALVVALRDGRAPLRQHLADASLRLSKLESLRWRVSEDVGSARAHAADLQLTVRAPAALGTSVAPPERLLKMRLSADTLSLLHAELLKARELVPAPK